MSVILWVSFTLILQVFKERDAWARGSLGEGFFSRFYQIKVMNFSIANCILIEFHQLICFKVYSLDFGLFDLKCLLPDSFLLFIFVILLILFHSIFTPSLLNSPLPASASLINNFLLLMSHLHSFFIDVQLFFLWLSNCSKSAFWNCPIFFNENFPWYFKDPYCYLIWINLFYFQNYYWITKVK
jgi:hypothetical protein